MRVIIADDATRECNVIKRTIEEYFPQLTVDGVFQNGTELMNYLEKNTPDLMISDIVMPGFDGLTACKKLREKSNTARIILITAFQKFEYAKDAITHKVSEFVVKPYTTEQMIAAISRTLGIDTNSLAQSFIKALKNLQLDLFFEENKDTLSALSGTQLEQIISEIVRILELGVELETFPLNDWHSCFRKLSTIYYNQDPHKYTVQKAIDFIRNNFSNSALSRTMIADYLSISESYLSELFKSEMHIGLSSYITQVRVDTAKKLLLEGTLSINEISTAVGCSTTKYFHETFKKATHITPAQYQMRKRLNENK